MELRNFSTTPNQLDSIMQRRPSLSSLSSASGYSSSNYGGNSTPQLANQRFGQGKTFNSANNAWGAPSLQANSTGSISASQLVANSVGPWVEEQQAQQQAGVASLDGLDSGALKENMDKIEKSTNDGHDNDTSNDKKLKGETKEANTNDETDRCKGNEINNESNENDDDELIPTAIVIKNIPFAIKKEQLLDVMTKLSLPLPYAFNYHFDNGVFRGLAFANFTLTEETSLVVGQLNGREIGGRKLRVEYKKMLPLQERERIEREKREKRGQLEEQHRSTSNASLASLLSATSTTAATKNLSYNGTGGNNQTERLYVTFPNPNSSQGVPPSELNFNDPEVLELYTQLAVYRDDISKSIFELAFPSNLSIGHRKILSILCSYLNLLELYDNGYIIIRRKQGYLNFNMVLLMVASQHQGQNSASMMNLNHLSGGISSNQNNLGNLGNPTHPELLRSQSQSALQLPRLRQQNSTPVQPQGPGVPVGSNNQNQLQQQSRPLYGSNLYNFQGTSNQNPNQSPIVNAGISSSSAAALLRTSNNRSFVDVRSTAPMGGGFNQQVGNESPTPQHYSFLNNKGNNPSQPSTPLAGEINSRFAPFGNSSNIGNSYPYQGSAQNSQGLTENFNKGGDSLVSKLNSINLIGNYESPTSSTSGIWGNR